MGVPVPAIAEEEQTSILMMGNLEEKENWQRRRDWIVHIRLVQHLIEKCLLLGMERKDCVNALAKYANIHPAVTLTVTRAIADEEQTSILMMGNLEEKENWQRRRDWIVHIRLVQHLIEKCLLLGMERKDCVNALAKYANIHPAVTLTVWKELLKENKHFFTAYFIHRSDAYQVMKLSFGDNITHIIPVWFVFFGLFFSSSAVTRAIADEEQTSILMMGNLEEKENWQRRRDWIVHIRLVQHLIEKCLLLGMDRKDCVNALAKYANIHPAVTLTVWKELLKENKDFFTAYFIHRSDM